MYCPTSAPVVEPTSLQCSAVRLFLLFDCISLWINLTVSSIVSRSFVRCVAALSGHLLIRLSDLYPYWRDVAEVDMGLAPSCELGWDSPPLGAKYCDEHVCVSVCPFTHIKNHTSKLHEILCMCCPGSWLHHPLTTIGYVMHFPFCG